MRFKTPVARQNLAAGSAIVVWSVLHPQGRTGNEHCRIWHYFARMLLTIFVLPTFWLDASCRTLPQADSSIAPERQSDATALSVTHVDAMLATEAGQMASEDQRRASQAYGHPRKKKYPHPDTPIKPVIPP